MTTQNEMNRSELEEKRRQRFQKRKQRTLILFFSLIFFVTTTLIFGILLIRAQAEDPRIQEMKDQIAELKKQQESLKDQLEEKEVRLKQYEVPLDPNAATSNTQQGSGKNHNLAANAYAFNTRKVREATTNPDYAGPKVAFLTFDDGPSAESTNQILDILKEKGAVATFFLVGQTITDDTEEAVQRIYREGHGIALHSWTHDYGTLYPGREGDADTIVSEMERTEKRLQEFMPKSFNTKVWRYPGGHMSWKNLEEADKRMREKDGVEWIDWNAMNGDAEPVSRRPTTPEESLQFLKDSLQWTSNSNCLVILMHDKNNKEITREALPSIIDWLKSEGYAFGILE